MNPDKTGPSTQMESKQVSFGNLLHGFRAVKKISQLNLAVHIKKSPSDISRWEKGIRKSLPERETVIDIADALDISITDKNRLLQAAGYEIPVSDMGVDLANPAIMKIVDVLASTKMSPDRMEAFEKDIFDFVEIWKKFQDLDGNSDETEQKEGYKVLFEVELSNFIDGVRIRLSHALGKSSKHLGQFQEAIRWYEQALSIAFRIENPKWTSQIKSCLGDVYREMNNSKARKYYEEAALIFDNELNDKVNSNRNRRKMASVDLVMGTKTKDFDSLNILDSCKLELVALLQNRSMEDARQYIQENLCKTLYLIGWANSIDGKTNMGIQVRLDGLNLAKELENKYLITQGYRYLGDDFDNIDDLDNAEKNYRNALVHCSQIGNLRRKKREESCIHRGLGTILAKQSQRWEEAEVEFKNSLDYKNDNRLMAMNLNKYGVFLLSRGDILHAIDVLYNASYLFEAIDNKYYMITTTMNLAEAYCKKEDLFEAKKLAVSALNDARRLETTRLVIPALEKFVYVTFASEEFKGALDDLKEFNELCSQIWDTNGLDGIKRILTSRVASLIELKHYPKAIDFASSLIDFFDGSKDPKAEDFRNILREERLRAITLLEREEKMKKTISGSLPSILNY